MIGVAKINGFACDGRRNRKRILSSQSLVGYNRAKEVGEVLPRNDRSDYNVWQVQFSNEKHTFCFTSAVCFLSDFLPPREQTIVFFDGTPI